MAGNTQGCYFINQKNSEIFDPDPKSDDAPNGLGDRFPTYPDVKDKDGKKRQVKPFDVVKRTSDGKIGQVIGMMEEEGLVCTDPPCYTFRVNEGENGDGKPMINNLTFEKLAEGVTDDGFNGAFVRDGKPCDTSGGRRRKSRKTKRSRKSRKTRKSRKSRRKITRRKITRRRRTLK
jgi:hypothetical protein